MKNLLDLLGVMVIGFAVVAALIWGVIWFIRKGEGGKCLNCGRPVKEVNLFCPWCHRDLRGGGKD